MSIADAGPGVIAVPCAEVMWTASAAAIFAAASNAPGGTLAWYDWHTIPTIEKRNHIVSRFLAMRDRRWLLMIDSDMIPPRNLVGRLLASALEPGRDIVAALCFARHNAPFKAAAGYWAVDGGYRHLGLKDMTGTVAKVDWVGTGCVLIWRHVLATIAAERGPAVFRGLDRNGRATGRGEDEELCRRAGELGFAIYCDTGTEVGHLGLQNINRAAVAALDPGCSTQSKAFLDIPIRR